MSKKRVVVGSQGEIIWITKKGTQFINLNNPNNTFPYHKRSKTMTRWPYHSKIHREGGPAIVYPNGDKRWYLDGICHREDGPAVEDANGTRVWLLHGRRHRADGPAIIYPDGSEEWWVDGENQKIQ